MLHAAHKLGDQTAKVRCLKALDGGVVDQLSAAALKFTERDYHDAINTYKDIILKNRSYTFHSDNASITCGCSNDKWPNERQYKPKITMYSRRRRR